ncbi:MAG: lysophospholipid acyltransferase family protein [Planctomycetota bacterium]
MTKLDDISTATQELQGSCRDRAGRDRPDRKPFSLTRARRSGDRLSRADGLRAAVFASAVQTVIWAIEKTMRVRTVNEASLAPARHLGPGSLLFAMWHRDYFPVMSYARDSGACVVVSRSPDGEILARLLNRYGYRTVRGSNTRGATRAMIDLARVVEGGEDAAVAVDGPKGPISEVKPGIVLLAKVTGCPIIPLGVGMSHFKQFASWDLFRMPLPLSRVVLTAGDAIQVPLDASAELMEITRRQLERSLSEQKRRAGDVAREHFASAAPPAGYAASRNSTDGEVAR